MDLFCLDNLFFEEKRERKKEKNNARVISLHAPPYALPYIGEDSMSF